MVDAAAKPLGMFDSGFGGLTVARAVIDLLPHEDLVYVGDTARYPYGTKPLPDVRSYATQIAKFLVDEHDVKALIVACNTASAAALDDLQQSFGIPVLGVIAPGVRSLVRASRNNRVGVIGTTATVRSGAYQRNVERTRRPVSLTVTECPGFVEFVERGEFDSDEVRALARRLLAPQIEAGVDTLLLGCTHYPYLARAISDAVGRDVVLISSADETAFELRHRLESNSDRCTDEPAPTNPAHTGWHRFMSSGDVQWFRELGRRLLGPELDVVEHVSWD